MAVTKTVFSLMDYRWPTAPKILIAEILLIFSAAVLLWAYGTNPVFQGNANYLLGLFYASGFVFAAAAASKSAFIFQTVGFGKTASSFFLAVVAGLFVAVLMNSGIFPGFSLIVPVSVLSSSTFSIIVTGYIAFLLEETFFRGVLLPSFIEMLSRLGAGVFSTPIGIIVVSAIFAVNHAFAIGVMFNIDIFTNPTIIFIFLFGVIASIGNGLLKSTGFSYTMHAAHNLFFLISSGAFIGMM